MRAIRLFYATNRAHRGRDRWAPSGYGSRFSADGMENLRFGMVDFQCEAEAIERALTTSVDGETGDGRALSAHLVGQVRTTARIRAFPEKLDRRLCELRQPEARLGSKAMFTALHGLKSDATDVLVFVHGFNVGWAEAVATAGALQEMLNHGQQACPLQVVLFSWPSDGLALPFVSYRSDRTEAAGSGYAFARGLLKVRDFLAVMHDPDGRPLAPCRRRVHLLCHSMGNYLLQHALARMADFTPGPAMPRLFDHVFMCAPDVDDDVLEPGGPMGTLHELARSVSVYHNRGDRAMFLSDHTKANPERLGTNGCARPAMVHNKVHQVDCSEVVEAGLDEHSYHLQGPTNADIRHSLAGRAQDDPARRRRRSRELPNVWSLG